MKFFITSCNSPNHTR